VSSLSCNWGFKASVYLYRRYDSLSTRVRRFSMWGNTLKKSVVPFSSCCQQRSPTHTYGVPLTPQ